MSRKTRERIWKGIGEISICSIRGQEKEWRKTEKERSGVQQARARERESFSFAKARRREKEQKRSGPDARSKK